MEKLWKLGQPAEIDRLPIIPSEVLRTVQETVKLYLIHHICIIYASCEVMIKFQSDSSFCLDYNFFTLEFSSIAVLLCASVVSYVAFVVFLFVPHLSFFWCLGVGEEGGGGGGGTGGAVFRGCAIYTI